MQNLTDISRALAKMYPELTNARALAITRSVFDLMKQGLTQLEPGSRNRVAISGFGNFGVKKTAARTVRNIRTKEVSNVEEGVRITFKPADELRSIVKSGEFEVQIPEKPSKEEPAEAAEKPAEVAEKPSKKAQKAETKSEEIDVDKIPNLSI